MITNEHNARVIPDIRRAIAEPAKWCISGRCPDTNWGGKDRLHDRDPENCPEFRKSELEGYLKRAGDDPTAALLSLGDTVASIIAPQERRGRIVGIRKRGRHAKRIIIREFEFGDGWFPTGELRDTGRDVLTPWPPFGMETVA